MPGIFAESRRLHAVKPLRRTLTTGEGSRQMAPCGRDAARQQPSATLKHKEVREVREVRGAEHQRAACERGSCLSDLSTTPIHWE